MSYFNVLIPPLAHPLLYEVTTDVTDRPQIGLRVLVPLKKKLVTGYLWEEVPSQDSGPEIKPISQILDPIPLFTEDQRPFFKWIADYYHYSLGQVLKTALPPGLTVSSSRRVELTPEGGQALTAGCLQEKEETVLQKLAVKGQPFSRFSGEEKKIFPLLDSKGWIRQDTFLKKETTRPKREKWIYPGSDFHQDRFQEKDRALCELLSAGSGLSLKALRKKNPLSTQRLATLKRKGLIEIREQICFRDASGELLSLEEGPFTLTEEQQKAVSRIEEGLYSSRYQALLLHGITGSGKTEVYVRAAAGALQLMRQSLIMVPEIGLVPQIEGRFRLRFGDKVALLHSGLSPAERYDEWRRVQTGSAWIVIGTRSAVFAPLPNLGLIVVDEEHDPSYKQTDSLRYNARDLALVRGRLSSAVVVLGSATPAVSSLYLRSQNKIGYLGLPKRVQDQPLPVIHLLDLKQFRRGRRFPLLAPPLEQAIGRNLQEGRQTLLFLNRRGFDTLILCTLCGAVLKCRNCSLTLTFHAKEERLLCHICGYRVSMPEKCPECHQAGIKALGLGTEKVEHELAAHFPQASIDRMDRDTVSRKKAHFEILKKVQERKTDILIGTQMITKGHDFPQVTLIGVLCADLSLNWPDFRGGERTFQLLAQVAGRAGRGHHPGQVYIQTFNPEHYIFNHIRRHDYLGFYEQEIRFRRDLKYPPFSRLINILFQGNQEKNVKTAAEKASGLLKRVLKKNQWTSSLEVLGPVPAPMVKIKGRYRWQMLLKGEDNRILHQAAGVISNAEKSLTQGLGVKIVLDVDPVDMI
jgi:primosomal protein N' (replication factor Y)